MDSGKASFSLPSPELVRTPEDRAPESDEPGLTHEDAERLRRRLALRNRQYGGLRVKRAFFRCPWPLTRRQYEEYRKKAVEKWLIDMEKQGWDLKSKVAVDAGKRRPAYGYSGDWVAGALLDQVEIPVAALFQKRKVDTVRLEVLVAS